MVEELAEVGEDTITILGVTALTCRSWLKVLCSSQELRCQWIVMIQEEIKNFINTSKKLALCAKFC